MYVVRLLEIFHEKGRKNLDEYNKKQGTEIRIPRKNERTGKVQEKEKLR